MQIKRPLILLVLASGSLFSFQNSNIKSWEKPVSPGLIYRMEMEQDPPRMIHVLRIVTSSPAVSFRPELAGKTIYEGANKGQGKVSDIVKENGAIAAINADFFPFTGDPLGLMVRQGDLVSLPYPKRVSFAWGPNGSVFGFARFNGAYQVEGEGEVKVDGFNEECPENRITLNTPDAGQSKAKGACLTVVLKVEGGKVTPSTVVKATVVNSTSDGANMPLTGGKFTLVATGNKIETLADLRAGQRLTIKTSTSGFDWERLEHAVSGGPILLREGNIFIDAENEGFNDDFANKRNPRTAIGRTEEGDLLFVTIDGRQKMSVGATLAETAEILQRLGCRDAINLDGGGSSCMNLFGLNVNRPSDKTGERPVANGIAFYGPQQVEGATTFKILSPATVLSDRTIQASVTDAKGKEIPNIEVIWSLQGSAWIDQGGQITGLEPGEATLTAYVRGSVITTKIVVK
jgi:exopolysaccharide biosynthesis protein